VLVREGELGIVVDELKTLLGVWGEVSGMHTSRNRGRRIVGVCASRMMPMRGSDVSATSIKDNLNSL
jgi:hypothetical protein